ncbi:MAG: amidohydrolase family protein [Cellulosilyticaceae bacterium]
MVIDFRSRPPYKGFVTEGNFFPRPMEDQFAHPKDVPAIYRNSVGIESARVGDFELYMQELGASGIDMQVIQGRQVREGMARVNNDDVCELQIVYPDKFISFPSVDCSDVEAAVKEIERCYKLYNIKGISLEPGWSNPPTYVDDRKLDPIYEKCEEYGLICAFTLSVLAGEDLSYCNPIHLQKVALRFPRVIFTVSHGCWPYVQEFLGAALHCMNIYFYPDFFCCLPDMPFADQFVKAANSYMRYRMMFATSYPVRPLAQSLEQFKKLPFDKEVLDLLLYQNAKDILKL